MVYTEKLNTLDLFAQLSHWTFSTPISYVTDEREATKSYQKTYNTRDSD